MHAIGRIPQWAICPVLRRLLPYMQPGIRRVGYSECVLSAAKNGRCVPDRFPKCQPAFGWIDVVTPAWETLRLEASPSSLSRVR
eukprot:4941041-Pyramimonas_sp.AAC.1